MKKIPTIFERDWNGDRSRVLPIPNSKCQWVFDGEGVATRKLDGTCVLVRDGKRYKRRELRDGEREPAGFEKVDFDEETGKTIGWVPVGDGPEDRWHREASGGELDGTYELIGPKIQGNPEHAPAHILCRHGIEAPDAAPPLNFDGLRAYLNGKDIEGIVWRHPDGRMAKIKLRDFGLKRRPRDNP